MKAVTTLLVAALAVAEAADATRWTSKGSSEDYISKLNDDTDEFVTSLAQWISDSTDVNFSIDSSFTLHTEGAEWSESCGDLSVQSAFKVLQSFIEHPDDANKDIKQVSPLQWRPSDDCVDKREYLFLDGGAHAEFKVLCGHTVLVEAIAGGGGFYVPLSRGKDKYSGGALASVDIEHHQVQVAGSIHSGKHLHGGLYEDKVENAFKVLAELKDTTQACTNNGTLRIEGVAGGGWTQKYLKHGQVVTSVVGYAESFSISPENAVEIEDLPATTLPAPTPAVTVPTVVPTPSPTAGEPDFDDDTPEPTNAYPDTSAPTTTEAAASTVTPVIEAATPYPTSDNMTTPPAPTPAVTVPTGASTPEPTTGEPDVDETSAPTTTSVADTPEPTTEAPTTEAPTTEAPTTEAPTTETPTIDSTSTEAPTEAPSTEAPTTEAPTTE
ncbi:hypothetical protein DYB32_005813, partial [Aphanomyces invadans]